MANLSIDDAGLYRTPLAIDGTERIAAYRAVLKAESHHQRESADPDVTIFCRPRFSSPR